MTMPDEKKYTAAEMREAYVQGFVRRGTQDNHHLRSAILMARRTAVPRSIRQGDVLLVPCAKIPTKAVPVPRDQGRVVLAYGEVTGHAHALIEPGVELLTSDDVRYLRVDVVSQLLHEEHTVHEVQPGAYRVLIQREYSPEAIRDVAD
jgi:hypothetical protein